MNILYCVQYPRTEAVEEFFVEGVSTIDFSAVAEVEDNKSCVFNNKYYAIVPNSVPILTDFIVHQMISKAKGIICDDVVIEFVNDSLLGILGKFFNLFKSTIGELVRIHDLKSQRFFYLCPRVPFFLFARSGNSRTIVRG